MFQYYVLSAVSKDAKFKLLLNAIRHLDENRSELLYTSAIASSVWIASRSGLITPAINQTGNWVGLRVGLNELLRRKVDDPAGNGTPVV